MQVTKTTILLPEALRRRLKRVAAERGTTVTALVTEGSELVLARCAAQGDLDTLRQRAAQARERLRSGLYDGPRSSLAVDEVVYGPPPRRARSPRR